MIKKAIIIAAIIILYSCTRTPVPTPTNPTVDPNYGKTHYSWVSGFLISLNREAKGQSFNTNQDINFTTDEGIEVFIPKRGHNLGQYPLIDSNITILYHDYTSIKDLMVRGYETRAKGGEMLISRAAFTMKAWNSKQGREYDQQIIAQNPVSFSLTKQSQNPTPEVIAYNEPHSWKGWEYKTTLTRTYDPQTKRLSFSGFDNHSPINIVHRFQNTSFGDLEVLFDHDSVRINTNAIQGDYELFLISQDERSFLRFERIFGNNGMTPNGVLHKVENCVPLGEKFDLWAMVIHNGRLFYQKKSFTMDSNLKQFTMDTFTPISEEDLIKELDKYTQ